MSTRTVYKAALMLVVLITAMTFRPGAGLAETSDQILAQIQKRHAGLTSIKANYTRVTKTPAMEGVFQSTSTHTASGVLTFKKPAKLRLDQSSPRTEKMVTDGRTVWWYIQDEKLVHRYSNVNVYGELKPLLDFLGGLSSLKGHFSVKVTPAGQGKEKSHRLDLTRLRQTSGPTDITVWFNPKDLNLSGFRLTSLTGETTDFTLRNVQLSPRLSDRSFVFRIPSGVQVVEEVGQ